MNNANEEIYTDISVIIGMMPIEMKSKISKDFINFIENNKSDKYVSNINPKIPLKEQEIKKEVKEVLGIIYRDYLCDETERDNLLKEEKIELEQLKIGLADKYNLNKVFNNKLKEDNKESHDVEIAVKNEEKLFIRFINFIKKLFKYK